ncbi:response regulator transcription factor [Plantactinospora sp. DSM 117369]
MTRILVVEGEPHLLHVLRINLRARGYAVNTAGDARSALRIARRARPDLIVIDLPPGHMAGVRVIGDLRRWYDVPILVISTMTATSTKIDALDAGADDYVVKPFDMRELLARIRALARRGAGASADAEVLRFGRCTVELDQLRVLVDGGGLIMLPAWSGVFCGHWPAVPGSLSLSSR